MSKLILAKPETTKKDVESKMNITLSPFTSSCGTDSTLIPTLTSDCQLAITKFYKLKHPNLKQDKSFKDSLFIVSITNKIIKSNNKDDFIILFFSCPSFSEFGELTIHGWSKVEEE